MRASHEGIKNLHHTKVSKTFITIVFEIQLTQLDCEKLNSEDTSCVESLFDN